MFLMRYLKNLINHFLARRVARGLSDAQRRRSALKAVDTDPSAVAHFRIKFSTSFRINYISPHLVLIL